MWKKMARDSDSSWRNKSGDTQQTRHNAAESKFHGKNKVGKYKVRDGIWKIVEEARIEQAKKEIAMKIEEGLGG
jgi:hypothetical protein